MNAGVPHLAQPLWLLALLLLPVLVYRHYRHPSVGALTYSKLPVGAGGSWRLHLPFYCRLAALALLIAALARPQLGFSWEETTTEGIDIQLALDVSGSMAAEDFEPDNRLHVAKQVISDFVLGRPGDRIGLIVFAGAAITKAPPTTDRTMLTTILDSVELRTLPDGTAIGMALASAASRLKESEAKSKIIVLVTDGDNNAGQIDPSSASAVCEGLGIKVYTVLVGKQDGAVMMPVQTRDPFSGRIVTKRVPVEVRVNPELLQNIAERTGGRFFAAGDPAALKQIFHAIDQLERTPLEVRRIVRYQERFAGLAWGALALLCLPLLTTLLGVTAEP